MARHNWTTSRNGYGQRGDRGIPRARDLSFAALDAVRDVPKKVDEPLDFCDNDVGIDAVIAVGNAARALSHDQAATGASSLSLRPNTARARITSPIPVSTRAIPTTMLKIESCSAMYETFSAVASAVSVTQRFRAPFEIG